MKLLIVAASTVALLCAAPFAIAIANSNAHNAIELNNNNNLDESHSFEKQRDSLLSLSEAFMFKGDDSKPNTPGHSTTTKNEPTPKTKNPKPNRSPTHKTPSPKTPSPKTPSPKTSSPKTPSPKPKPPRPTPKPKQRSTPRPTPRPKGPPTSDRQFIRELLAKYWCVDECIPVHGHRMSRDCEDLDDLVCSKGYRDINRTERDLCEKVGLRVSRNTMDSKEKFDSE